MLDFAFCFSLHPNQEEHSVVVDGLVVEVVTEDALLD